MPVIQPLAIPDVVALIPEIHGDQRGYFFEAFRLSDLAPYGATHFVQGNQSKSSKGILRGLHYQRHQPQGKLLRVISGRIFDVAVDLRPHSPTFKQHVALELSCEQANAIWIPPGLAHGFLVLSQEAVISYQCTAYYAPEHERSLLWSDPQLNIAWPLAQGKAPVLSNKDREALTLDVALRELHHEPA